MKKGTVSKVLGYIKAYNIYVILSLLFAVISVAFTLYVPILVGQAIDCIVGKGKVDFESILYILLKIHNVKFI